MRRAISKHMQQSLALSAQLTSMGEVEATNLKKFRADLVSQEETLGTRITYNDIYVLALAKTLKDIPMVNSSLVDDDIIVWEDINIGVAVALEGADVMGGGLIVPVVRRADKKSLTEISKELKNTIQKAREGKLLPDDVTGSTFTLTNMGGLGSGWGYGTPIINQPESAILGTGAIVDRPVVREGEIVIRAMMPVSFTFDHRVLDGVPAGMFMGRLRQYIEDPLLLLV
jgi:pyruvate dehydrogenase E2 component (dihydrolipoamide acetyltransferase)/2-oxoglutarate dehydrogenase E2 component (dihydrolipoamide succinyltransferase)